jgi:GT2 family glycosyltransferase
VNRKTTLIVLAWNRWDLTRHCLETLRTTDLTGAEVLVVDNGSTDETPQRLAELGWVRVLTLPENLGFVRGNNAGIQAADPASDVVLLNNDLEFRQKDWLQKLKSCAHARPETGVVGCRLVLPDGRLLHAGTYILPDTFWGQQIGSLEKEIGQYARDREVQGIVFACAFIKREVLRAVGGLAEDFHSYFEDTDYCLQAREHGFRTVLCGSVTLVHDEHGSTAGKDGLFTSIFSQSREVFGQKWGERLRDRYRVQILWQSILNFSTGYARSCRELVHALEAEDVRAVYRYVYGPGTPFPIEEDPETGDYLLNVVRSRRRPLLPRIGVVYGQGDVFRRNAGRYKVGYTMLEVDGFPSDWVRQANRMDEVWVPAEFNREGFLRCGLKRPIHVMPLGVNPDYFHPGIRAYPNPLGEFVFLTNFEWGERKEPWLLLKAFNETFSSREPVRLLCKVINRDPSVRLKQEIRNLELEPTGGRISFLFNLDFPHYQLGSLYRSADCFLSVGRGEGWDMPLMEAMACGLPSIATDWGAHRDFVHEGTSYPLRIRGTIPAVAKCPYYEGFAWSDPDPEHLRHLLRHVYENRDEARAKGCAAAQEMVERWTWEQAAKRIAARLDAITQ